MNLQQRVNRMLEKIDRPMAWFWAAVITGHECVCEDDLYTDRECFDIIREFTETATETIDASDDATVLTETENCLKTVLSAHQYPEERMEDACTRIRSLFLEERVQNIEDEAGSDETEDGDIITPGIYDLHNLELAYLFADMPRRKEDDAFFERLGISGDAEQIRATVRFAEQILPENGAGKPRCPNLSGEIAYGRIRRPESLLWMLTVLGEDRKVILELYRKIHEGGPASPAERCAAIRKAVPFARIYDLAYEFFFEEAEEE